MRFLFTAFALLLFCHANFAQYVPTPGEAQSQPILLQGATAHLGNGQVIENAYVAFADGKFTVVQADAAAVNFKTHKIIDVTGKHIYPGFVALNSQLGLNEIGAVRATNDYREVGLLNPNIRALIAYNTDSEVIPTVRSNGILYVQITPQGGRISGQSSVVNLDAWNYEDAAVRADDGIHLNWPRIINRSRWTGSKKNDKYDEQIRETEELFNAAQAYGQRNDGADTNLKLAAMQGLFDGSKKLYLHVNDVTSMQSGVLFAEKYGITPVIVGGRDSWMITDFLKEHDVAVVLNSTQSLPHYEDSDIDQPFKTPAALEAAGVTWCFSHGSYWDQKNLPFIAGQAVGFGLDYEAAVRALTATPAKIVGTDAEAGTLEVGKTATLIVSEGDAFDMRGNKISRAFIDGREVNLENKHKALYRKFGKK